MDSVGGGRMREGGDVSEGRVKGQGRLEGRAEGRQVGVSVEGADLKVEGTEGEGSGRRCG